MANKKYDDQDGVWRTVGGRRIFIKNGQSLEDAMKESGKFNTAKKENKKDDKYIGNISKETYEKFKEEMKNEFGDKIKFADEKGDASKVEELENGYKGKGKDLLQFINDEEEASGLEISKELKNELRNNPDKEYVFDNNEEVLKDPSDFNEDRLDKYDVEKLEGLIGDGIPQDVYDEFTDITGEDSQAINNAIGQFADDCEGYEELNDFEDEYGAISDYDRLDNLYSDMEEYLDNKIDEGEIDEDFKNDIMNYFGDAEDTANSQLDEEIENYLKGNNYRKEEKNIKVKEGNPIEDLINKEGINAGGRLREIDSEAEEFFNQIKNANRTDEEAKTLLHFKYPNSNEDNLLDRYKQWSKTNEKEAKDKSIADYEYNLYKQARENPDSINPMTENSTDWEDLDRRYHDKYENEKKSGAKEEYKLAKDKAFKDMKDAENAWLEHYNKYDYNNEEWRKESDRLQKERDNAREDYEKKFKKYLDTADENDLSWQDKVSRNDIQMEKQLEEIKSQRGQGQYMYHPDKWDDDYYGTFRKYEKENAKLKAEGAKPDEEYVPLNSYGTYKEKRDKLEGIERNANGTKNYDTMKDATWTGKEYTNDEFFENLEDENWHTERRMIQTAGLTNQEVEYIKDHTTFHNGSPSLDRESTQKLIDEAKAKYRGNNKSVGKNSYDYKIKNDKDFNKYVSDNYGIIDTEYDLKYKPTHSSNSITNSDLRNRKEWQEQAIKSYNDSKLIDKGYRWRDENDNIIKPSKTFKNIGGGDYVKQNEDGSSIHISGVKKPDGTHQYTRWDYDENGNDIRKSSYSTLAEAKAGKTTSEAMNEKIRSKANKHNTTIKSLNDGELNDVSKGWAVLSNSDASNKKEQTEIRKLAREEIKNRKQTPKKSSSIDDVVVENNYQRYSGTIDYLKEIGLSSSQISQIIDKMKKDDYNKK